MILGLFRRKGLCWICLEESTMDSSWTRHECGCNLQVHKCCYFRWLFDLNKSSEQGKWGLDLGFEPLDELRRNMCYLVDCHREFQSELSAVEVMTFVPLLKGAWVSTFEVSPLGAVNAFTINLPLSLEHQVIAFPIVIPPCPQCKRPIFSRPVHFTSSSVFLSAAYQVKKLIRAAAVMALLTVSTLNIGKWAFNLGLWQLRCLFPERVLRSVLRVSTTKALDVYGETMQGRRSIPSVTQFLVLGFPFYLMGLRGSSRVLNKLQWIYSLVFTVRAGHHTGKSRNALSHLVSVINLSVLFNSTIVSPTLTRIYEFMVKKARPYFCLTSDSMDIFPSQEYSNIIIKTSWHDVLFEAAVWPWCGEKVGSKLFDLFVWVQKEIPYKFTPEASPDEVRMVFNVLGCGLLAIARQSLNLYITYRRAQELRKLQDCFDEK
ncbi:hypothetical protein HG536_0A08390 [Torulaspora globosa]|uniref:RING-CH-type domain-containing protein n=1 Tax=Torulaspora globosa TaxID=48254 RepID=A0A7G3ZBY8_9SACH|nr:uncharacterized protein HG536_0A08390 [Torulaspora globosa]QLL31024.1 hypothetical protein HG536_0A08390 [Torulaspora globosa]